MLGSGPSMTSYMGSLNQESPASGKNINHLTFRLGDGGEDLGIGLIGVFGLEKVERAGEERIFWRPGEGLCTRQRARLKRLGGRLRGIFGPGDGRAGNRLRRFCEGGGCGFQPRQGMGKRADHGAKASGGPFTGV